MIGDLQWRRYAEVRFRNFDTGEVTKISSAILDENGEFVEESLRISFEYTKSDDQGFNTPNGKITIYGLSEDTFKSLGERMRCEIEVVAGYLESQQNAPNQLFYAVLMNKSFEIKEGMSTSNFEVLGDFMEKNINTKMNNVEPQTTIFGLLQRVGEAIKFKADMYFPEMDTEDTNNIKIFLTQKQLPYPYTFTYNVKTELERLRKSFGITHSFEKNETLEFRIHNSWVQWYIDKAREFVQGDKKADTTLVAENKTASKVAKPTVILTLKDEFKMNKSLMLNEHTGLIGTPVLTTPITSKQYNEALAEGEVVWERKYPKVVIDKKTGKPKTDKKTGQVKMTKTPKKFKVARRTVVIKCFINYVIEFNTLITLQSKAQYCDGVYRVRSVKIKGDTNGSDWHMELELNE